MENILSNKQFLMLIVVLALFGLALPIFYPIYDGEAARFALRVINNDSVPFSAMLQKFSYQFLGRADFVFRLPSFIYTLLSVALFFVALRRKFPIGLATTGTLLFMLLAGTYWASFSVEPYGFALFMSTLSFLCLLLFKETYKIQYMLFMALFGLLAFWGNTFDYTPRFSNLSNFLLFNLIHLPLIISYFFRKQSLFDLDMKRSLAMDLGATLLATVFVQKAEWLALVVSVPTLSYILITELEALKADNYSGFNLLKPLSAIQLVVFFFIGVMALVLAYQGFGKVDAALAREGMSKMLPIVIVLWITSFASTIIAFMTHSRQALLVIFLLGYTLANFILSVSFFPFLNQSALVGHQQLRTKIKDTEVQLTLDTTPKDSIISPGFRYVQAMYFSSKSPQAVKYRLSPQPLPDSLLLNRYQLQDSLNCRLLPYQLSKRNYKLYRVL